MNKIMIFILVGFGLIGNVNADSYYVAEVSINGKIFHDVITLGEVVVDNRDASITRNGTLTVPGQLTTSFIAKQISSGVYVFPNYTFTAKAIEFGNEIDIEGRLKLGFDETVMTGSLEIKIKDRPAIIAPLKGQRVFQNDNL